MIKKGMEMRIPCLVPILVANFAEGITVKAKVAEIIE